MKAEHATAGSAVGVTAPARAPARAVNAGPLAGMVAQVLLIAALAGTVPLSGSAPGWVVGLTCAVIMNVGLARGLSRHRYDRLSPADWVTLARATLAVGVAVLVAESFDESVPGALLVSLAAIALALDAVDGWVARRTRTTAVFGARFDGEVDAFLILVLSVYVARSAGAWVLAIGAARYVFGVGEWLLPWMRRPLPERYWRKVVAATQGVVLTIAAADVLSPTLTDVALVGALVLLAESFGRDLWWLRAHRHEPAVAIPGGPSPSPSLGRRRARTAIVVTLTILAGLLVWVALVIPDEPTRLHLTAFLSVPLEGLILVALALALPPKAQRVLVWVVGPLLAVVVVIKLLDLGFWTGFDRPFDLYQDVGYAKIGSETLRDSFGASEANLIIAGLVAVAVALLVVMTLAVRRVTTVAAGHPRWALRTVAALGTVWMLSWVFGAHLVAGAPIASTSSAGVVVDQVSQLQADLNDHAVFAKQIAHDPLRKTPTDRLLTSLRGKDVILAFVEAYGKVAVQDSAISPQIDATLASGTAQLRSAGFSARSGFLTSTTFGGISWLAHSSVQSGLTVNSQNRYDQLVKTNRFTLSQAFGRAGWRTVDDVPSNSRAWPQGKSFYHYDKLYDRRNVGYRGPPFGYASMPDQYVMEALRRLELAKAHRRPVFAEVDLVSSHVPWVDIPHLVDWRKLGNGSIFNTLPSDKSDKDTVLSDPAHAQAAYAESIQYTMNALISYVAHYRDPNLVLVVVGDHQPWTIVTGLPASHDVPISIIAHDPAVLKRIGGWGWNDGLLPRPSAPVWPMAAFRDRFLHAFDTPAATR